MEATSTYYWIIEKNLNKNQSISFSLNTICLFCPSSHYSRKDNIRRRYLDSTFNTRKLYEKFQEVQHDAGVVDVGISADKFYRILRRMNVSFGWPRTDKCETCIKFEVDNKNAERKGETAAANALAEELETHKVHGKDVFDQIRQYTGRTEDVMALCFDYEKNLPLPVTNVGPSITSGNFMSTSLASTICAPAVRTCTCTLKTSLARVQMR